MCLRRRHTARGDGGERKSAGSASARSNFLLREREREREREGRETERKKREKPRILFQFGTTCGDDSKHGKTRDLTDFVVKNQQKKKKSFTAGGTRYEDGKVCNDNVTLYSLF